MQPGTDPLERFDYDEFTRYVSNLNCRYHRIDRKAEVGVAIQDLGKGHRGHDLSIYIGGVGQKLDTQQQRVLRELAESCMQQHVGAWIVTDLTLDTVYKSQVLPKDWVASVLPLIMHSDEYIADDYLYWRVDRCGVQCYCADAQMSCAKCSRANEMLVSERYTELLDELLLLYDQGSLAECTARFARDWKLERDARGLWHPTWWNSLLTGGDPTLYLSEMRNSSGSYDSASRDLYLRLEAS